MKSALVIVAAAGLLAGCALTKAQVVSDANTGLAVAAALEAAYAAQPNANANVVAEAKRLLTVAQSAEAAYAASNAPTDQAALTAAVAALVTYESIAGIK